MIIKSLLFIILCIFVYDTYKKFSKMSEEYFINLDTNQQEKFVNLSDDPNKNDISKTIAINCKALANNYSPIMAYKPEADEDIDNPYYARYKPIEYDAKRKYYWRTNMLVPEGIRRSIDDDTELAKLQSLFDNETDPDKKEELQDELNLFAWRANILSIKNPDTGLDRDMRDITTDYFPEEIGMNRPWIERHSHLPDYSEYNVSPLSTSPNTNTNSNPNPNSNPTPNPNPTPTKYTHPTYPHAVIPNITYPHYTYPNNTRSARTIPTTRPSTTSPNSTRPNSTTPTATR